MKNKAFSNITILQLQQWQVKGPGRGGVLDVETEAMLNAFIDACGEDLFDTLVLIACTLGYEQEWVAGEKRLKNEAVVLKHILN